MLAEEVLEWVQTMPEAYRKEMIHNLTHLLFRRHSFGKATVHMERGIAAEPLITDR